jgi:hypothetical protein
MLQEGLQRGLTVLALPPSGLTDSATIPMMMPAIVNAIQRITRNE